MSQNLRVATFVPIADPAAIGNLIKTTAGPTANRRLASAFAADISGSGGGGGIEEAPIDSVAYARKNAGWVPEVGGGGGGTPGGSTTQVQFNDAGAFAGDAGLTYNKTTNVLTSTGGQFVLAGGTVTASAPIIVGTQTWNNAAVDFNAIEVDVTALASSNNTSNLINLKLGGTSRFRVTVPDGIIYSGSHIINTNGIAFGAWAGTDISLQNTGIIHWSSSNSAISASDVGLTRSAAGVLDVQNGITGGQLRDLRARKVILAADPAAALEAATKQYVDAHSGGGGVIGTDMQVPFNNAGAMSGSAKLMFQESAGLLYVAEQINTKAIAPLQYGTSFDYSGGAGMQLSVTGKVKWNNTTDVGFARGINVGSIEINDGVTVNTPANYRDLIARNVFIGGTEAAGYLGVPQNSKSANYTTVLADSGKHILHPIADNNARTFTIDSNASVAYPVGTAITIVNEINTVTIAIATDTMVLAGAGTTGSRTLAANGMATALKIAATKWIISGPGLT